MRKNWVIPGFCAVLLYWLGVQFGTVTLPFFPIPEELRGIAELRAIRMLAAFTVGGSLALAGLLLQGVLRNVLAEPFILGVSGGAGTGAALAVIAGATAWSQYAVPVCGFAGALIVLLFVLAVSRGVKGGPERLLLSGVIASTICGSVLTYLLSTANSEELAGITWWMLGDLQTCDLKLVVPGTILLAVVTVLGQACAPALNVLETGAEQAFYFGVNPRRTIFVLTVAASLLTAWSVATAGMIGFCGLIVPHGMRLIYGSDHRRNLIPTTLSGGCFLMLCDVLSRSVCSEREIPIGVLTSLIGGPLFLYLLNRRRQAWF